MVFLKAGTEAPIVFPIGCLDDMTFGKSINMMGFWGFGGSQDTRDTPYLRSFEIGEMWVSRSHILHQRHSLRGYDLLIYTISSDYSLTYSHLRWPHVLFLSYGSDCNCWNGWSTKTRGAGIAGKNQVSQSGLFLVLMLIGFAMVTPSTPSSKRRMASDHFLVGNDPRFLRRYKMDRVENS